MRTLTMQRIGGHRGGWDGFFQTWQLAEKEGKTRIQDALQRLTTPDGSKLPVKLEVVDPVEKRAQALAQGWELKGIPASFRVASVEDCLEEDVLVRALAIDDPWTIVLVLEKGQQRLLQYGILVAANFPPGIGRVITIGATINEGDEGLRTQATLLMGEIARLVGERTSSREMSVVPIQAAQMVTARQLLHREIARDTLEFLTQGEVSSRLFAVETLALAEPFVYPIKLVELDKIERSTLNERAIDEVHGFQGEAQVVVFHETRVAKPWLYLAFLTRRQDQWFTRYNVELPTPPEYLTVFENATAPRVVTTD